MTRCPECDCDPSRDGETDPFCYCGCHFRRKPTKGYKRRKK